MTVMGLDGEGMSAIIVTGGAGFIGSNFVHWLLTWTDAEIVIIDKLTYAGHLISIEDVLKSDRVTFIQADIADQPTVCRLIAERYPQAIVNFAAESHVDRSIDSPAPFVETNIVGTFVLLEAARQYWMGSSEEQQRRFRFVQVSTDEVYGTLGQDGFFSEQTPYAPNSPYAASKAAADHLVHTYFHTYGLPTLITNCSNNYGPYQFPEKLIPLMLFNALEAKPLPIYGDGQHIRDWLHVEDHCEGIRLILTGGQPGERYNIGGNNEHTNLELVNMLVRIIEELMPASRNQMLIEQGLARYEELKTFVADRPGHDRRYAIDATKMRTHLGWKPRHDLESGLRQTVQWYLDHQDWCQAVQVTPESRKRRGLHLGVGKGLRGEA